MKKNILKIIFITTIIFILKEVFVAITVSYENVELLNSYYKNDSSFNYKNYMIIDIPKINLNQVVKKANDDFSNLDKNLVYYKNTDYRKTIIIFGHSGLGYGTYFNRLEELKEGDMAYLNIDKLKTCYYVDKKYIISETNVDILNTDKKNTLILITCLKKNKNKRLVLELVSKQA